MKDLDQVLIDAFQIMGVLLVFITVLFGLATQSVADVLEERKPEGTIDIQLYRKKVRAVLLRSVLLLAVMSTICSYLLLPLCIEVLRRSHVSLFDFDFFKTALILVELCMVGGAVWSISLMWRLILKLRA